MLPIKWGLAVRRYWSEIFAANQMAFLLLGDIGQRFLLPIKCY